MGRTINNACYRELGMELRRVRRATGMESQQLAGHLGWHVSKISRIEAGQVNISDIDVVHYLAPLGVFLRDAEGLLALCRDAMRNLGYWVRPKSQGMEDLLTPLIYHEAMANESVSYEPHLVPGLLQTQEYARAMISRFERTHEDIEYCVRARLQRKQILHQPNRRFTFLIHENALRLMVGDLAIMQEQMLALTLLDGLPNVRIRVVPASATFDGAFRLFRFAEHRPLIYVSNQATGLFLEDKEFVDLYIELIPTVAAAALDAGQSRRFLADRANEFDRRRVDDRVAEEQL